MTHTIRRTTPHVGRNAVCICGSGRKFKHCCLGRRAASPLAGLPAIDAVTLEFARLWRKAARLFALARPFREK